MDKELVPGLKKALSNMPEVLPPAFRPPTDHNLASEFYRRLVNWINDFHKSLDEEYEVGIRLVNFGQTVTFHVAKLGYWNPSLISFIGYTGAS